MKTFKYKLAIIVAFTQLVVFAQNTKIDAIQKEQIVVQSVQNLSELNLSESQKKAFKSISKKHKESLVFIMDSGLDKKEKLSEIQRIQLEKDKELKMLLSKKQYETYQKNKALQRKELLKNYSGKFSTYIERMNLSNEQTDLYIEISKKYAAQLKKLKNSSKSRFSKYRSYKSIQKNKNKEMKKLLSSKQYKVYLEIQKELQKEIKNRRKK